MAGRAANRSREFAKGWMVCPSAPAAADPYILADETIRPTLTYYCRISGPTRPAPDWRTWLDTISTKILRCAIELQVADQNLTHREAKRRVLKSHKWSCLKRDISTVR